MTINSYGFSLINVGNREEPLLQVVKKRMDGRIQVPSFQREFVWENDKVKGWAQSIRQGNIIGVIATYQLSSGENHHPVYLSDGLQRLTASEKFLENPAKYGFQSREEVESLMDRFTITVQHRHYSSHNEALTAFQILNAGTPATKHDVYKGELVNDKVGLYAYKRVCDAVMQADGRLTRQINKRGNESQSKYISDALSLFTQYSTGKTEIQLWNVSHTRPKPSSDKPVERDMANLLRNLTQDDVDALLVNFISFINGQLAMIEHVLTEKRGEGNVLSLGLLRSLLHTAIWRRNCKHPVEWYRKYLELIFLNSEDLTTKIQMPKTTRQLTLTINDAGAMFRIFDAYGVEYDPAARTKRRPYIKAGYDQSHVQPFSTHGNGETFPEPAPLNRARGAQPIQLELVAD